ncbi:MAG: tRNA pseudouridine(55) synthase TruB [Candidatus Sulfotelmatobacter sp.]
MNGVIILDKSAGCTSHDMVNRMRRILGQRSIGHLGTLDPLATGVLPLVTGSFTRLAQFYTQSEKTYEGVIRFGFATNTYDADGDPLGINVGTAAPFASSGQTPVSPQDRWPDLDPDLSPDLSLDMLQKLSTEFLGLIEQVPPPFSAKKIHGVPAYKLARKQKEVVLAPVQVEVKEFTILSVAADRACFRARVSSGTYMRSIAHEMGRRIGCGAHLESLRRTSVAEFDIGQAHTLEEIEGTNSETVSVPHIKNATQNCHSDRSLASPQGKGSEVEEPAVSKAMSALFIHPRQLLPQLPCVTADEATVTRIRNGRPVNLLELSRARQVKVFQGQYDLIAIATRVAGTLFHPKIVFPVE